MYYDACVVKKGENVDWNELKDINEAREKLYERIMRSKSDFVYVYEADDIVTKVMGVDIEDKSLYLFNDGLLQRIDTW